MNQPLPSLFLIILALGRELILHARLVLCTYPWIERDAVDFHVQIDDDIARAFQSRLQQAVRAERVTKLSGLVYVGKGGGRGLPNLGPL